MVWHRAIGLALAKQFIAAGGKSVERHAIKRRVKVRATYPEDTGHERKSKTHREIV